MTYMQARYYDADLGRFISTDPMSASAGDLYDFNRYAYANNNPLTFIDPTGQFSDVPTARKLDGVSVTANVPSWGFPAFVNVVGGGGGRTPMGGPGEGGGIGAFSPAPKDQSIDLYCLKEWQIRGIAGAVIGAGAGAILGSESGPGAAGSAIMGGLVNGGLGIIDGLSTSRTGAAVAGGLGAMSTSGNRVELGTGLISGVAGGVIASDMTDRGYPRPIANAGGATVAGGVGSVVYTFVKGGTATAMFKAGLKGGGIGMAISVTQSGLESAIRAGNNSSCGK